MTFHGMPNKLIFALTALFCASLLVFALVLQYFVELVPCPLCIVQRGFYLLIGFVAALAFSGGIKAARDWWYGTAIMAFAVLGGAVAFRQVWLQRFAIPDDSTGCTVFFGSFVNSVILSLGGAGNCAIVDWTFLGLSIAEWSAGCFILLLLAGTWIVIGPRKSTRLP